MNEDSIGIEMVGNYDIKNKVYENINAAQNKSLRWLVDELAKQLTLGNDDVYRHPEVSYKKPSEARTAKWQ
jgi:hypothetical protein